MASIMPITVSKRSFQLCRTVVAALLVLSLILRDARLIGVVFVIMVWSAIVKVRKAPLIMLCDNTVNRLMPEDKIIVDENGIFFSHIIGAIFSLICITVLHFASPVAGWILTAAFTLLQLSAACGFCSALKLYTCMAGGTCCRFGKRVRKLKG